jgi:hypothetical protein
MRTFFPFTIRNRQYEPEVENYLAMATSFIPFEKRTLLNNFVISLKIAEGLSLGVLSIYQKWISLIVVGNTVENSSIDLSVHPSYPSASTKYFVGGTVSIDPYRWLESTGMPSALYPSTSATSIGNMWPFLSDHPSVSGIGPLMTHIYLNNSIPVSETVTARYLTRNYTVSNNQFGMGLALNNDRVIFGVKRQNNAYNSVYWTHDFGAEFPAGLYTSHAFIDGTQAKNELYYNGNLKQSTNVASLTAINNYAYYPSFLGGMQNQNARGMEYKGFMLMSTVTLSNFSGVTTGIETFKTLWQAG